MATLVCPKCDSRFTTGDGWANTAISTLIPAPAVPDMATQVRCPRCGHLFAGGEVRHLRASRSFVSPVAALLLALALVAWLLY